MKFSDIIRLNELDASLNETGFASLPKGWTDDSVKKFAKSLTGKAATKEGFFDKCVSRLSNHFDEDRAKRMCASIKDRAFGSTFWRGKDKPAKEVKKDVKQHPNVKREAE